MTTAPFDGQRIDGRRTRNPFAIVSIALAGAVVVVSLTTRTLALFTPAIAASQHVPIGTMGAILGVLGGLGVILALGAAAFGIVGVTRPHLPRGLSAAGLAIGATAAASYLLNLVSTLAVTSVMFPR